MLNNITRECKQEIKNFLQQKFLQNCDCNEQGLASASDLETSVHLITDRINFEETNGTSIKSINPNLKQEPSNLNSGESTSLSLELKSRSNQKLEEMKICVTSNNIFDSD